MTEQRLPVVNSDDGQWGDVLNQFIEKEHYNTGVNNGLNGGHKTITIRPGSSNAGTAPLKLSSGPLLSAPEIGAVEFLTDRLYYTQTTSSIRKVIASVDDIKHTPTAIWGDGVEPSSLAAGMKSYVRVPYRGIITSWTIVSDVACTCILDVWKSNSTLPTIANSITASTKPSLSASTTAASSTLTGWTTNIAVDDVLGFYLQSVTGSPTAITLVLNITNG